MKNIILLGMAGSGKGTQAKLLVEKYGYKHISAGDLLREETKKGTELGEKIKEIMKKGELLPDETIIELIKKATQGCEGIIFDGFPRTLEQAKALDEFCDIKLVISIELPDDVAVERLTKRRQCKKCGYITTDKYEKCPKCGGELYQREDDKEEAIRKRLKIYHEEVEPLKEYYKPRGIVRIIDGTKTIEEIHKEITEIIEKE
ncbi:adenylate kinase [Candidatus Woesearchaeota archaeon]|nr:MAG: adenylate kinase [Candidatus Woesearchaeota archaeon]